MSKAVRIQCEDLDAIKADVLSVVEAARRRLPGFRYGDVRLEASEGSYAWAENGDPKGSGRDFGLSLGARVIAGNGMAASGHYGMVLGPADVPSLHRVVRDALGHAHARARANADRKERAVGMFPHVAQSLASFDLAPIALKQDGSLSGGSGNDAVAHQNFLRLLEHARDQVGRISDAIWDGDITVQPYRQGKRTPCGHCEYRSVCGFEVARDHCRHLQSMRPQDIWSALNNA